MWDASRGVLNTRAPERPWLKYVVPWGDAIFNKAQADDLESDIADVKRANPDPDLLQILSEIEPLVAQLSRETHAYLWFVGD